jgi:hypothetical protein
MQREPYQVQVSLGLPGRLEALLAEAIGDVAGLFPNSLRALSALAEAAQRRWVAYASGALPLPSGHVMRRHTGTYAESVQTRVENPEGAVRFVVYSDDPKAAALEWGTPSWDMRRVLQTSHRARRAKEGHLYLIFPFRWGTPGTLAVGAFGEREMPEPVYTWWLAPDRQSSYITGSYQEPSIHDPGVQVSRLTYRWGDRLMPRDVAALGLDPSKGLGKRLVGMVRMQSEDDPRLLSAYLTFRTLSERSKGGWIHPGTPALGVAQAVYGWLRGIYPQLMERALQADVERLLKRAGQ